VNLIEPIFKTTSPARPRGIVLVVDDDDDLRELFVELLELGGWRAHAAASLGQARRKLAASRPDLLVLDFQLGGETSESLLAELATMSCAPAALLVSASPSAHAVALAYGVTLVAKPFDAEELLSQAETVVARARAGRSGTRHARLDAGDTQSRRAAIRTLPS
jgi:DNA-binding response OmpR family regulator